MTTLVGPCQANNYTLHGSALIAAVRQVAGEHPASMGGGEYFYQDHPECLLGEAFARLDVWERDLDGHDDQLPELVTKYFPNFRFKVSGPELLWLTDVQRFQDGNHEAAAHQYTWAACVMLADARADADLLHVAGDLPLSAEKGRA